LDVIMPKKNGNVVYEEIVRLKEGVRVIFTSGYTADIIERKGFHESGFHYLPKPVAPADLLAKVREVLGS
ncbi:MAG TPA: response regulator, partial [Verrucomicrobiae bacterium]|nr:response regulator [Verrucomicrobiae bacterium]